MTRLQPLVVVVDDDASMQKALGRALRAGGLDTASYSSAEAFLAAPPARLPLCLVLDVKLDGMSGLDLQRRLRALGSTLPIIFVSAFADAPVRAEAIRGGCVGCLDKQAEFGVLLEMIGQIQAASPPLAAGSANVV